MRMVHVNIRLPGTLLKETEALVRSSGPCATRSTVLRAALMLGLGMMARRTKRKRT